MKKSNIKSDDTSLLSQLEKQYKDQAYSFEQAKKKDTFPTDTELDKRETDVLKLVAEGENKAKLEKDEETVKRFGKLRQHFKKQTEDVKMWKTQHTLPLDVVVNLKETAFCEAAKKLRSTMPGTGDEKGGKKVISLENSYKELLRMNDLWKREYARSFVEHQKFEAINTHKDPMRTNTWNMGDLQRIREPQKKKQKKEKRSKERK